LYRYISSHAGGLVTRVEHAARAATPNAAAAGLYTLTPVSPLALKAPGYNLCAYAVKTWFQAFVFKFI
jgi:hypothetical protein